MKWMKNDLLAMKIFCPWLKTHFLSSSLANMYFFRIRKKILSWKKYFVQADGRGINFQKRPAGLIRILPNSCIFSYCFSSFLWVLLKWGSRSRAGLFRGFTVNWQILDSLPHIQASFCERLILFITIHLFKLSFTWHQTVKYCHFYAS